MQTPSVLQCPSAHACIRQAIRVQSQSLLPDRVASPKTSAYRPRSSLTVIRFRVATSRAMFNRSAMSASVR